MTCIVISFIMLLLTKCYKRRPVLTIAKNSLAALENDNELLLYD